MDTMTKKDFVEGTLAETLRKAKLDVNRLELSDDGNCVMIVFDNGYKKAISIEANSFGAIILDVTKRAMY